MKRSSLIVLIAMLAIQACSNATPVPAKSSKLAPSIGVPLTQKTGDAPLAIRGSAKSAAVPALCANTNADNASAFGDQVIQLTNAQRAKVNAPPVTKQDQLTNAAQAHSIDMACKLFMDHTGSDNSSPFDRMTRFGYVYGSAAENVAAGQATPAEVVDSWMNSEGHRANMLNPAYTQIGIGYVFNSDESKENNYGHYWTMKLGRP